MTSSLFFKLPLVGAAAQPFLAASNLETPPPPFFGPANLLGASSTFVLAAGLDVSFYLTPKWCVCVHGLGAQSKKEVPEYILRA